MSESVSKYSLCMLSLGGLTTETCDIILKKRLKHMESSLKIKRILNGPFWSSWSWSSGF